MRCCTFSIPFPSSHGLCPGAPGPPGPICPGISVAPSAFNFSSVWFLWYSMTLRFLKYVTYTRSNQHLPSNSSHAHVSKPIAPASQIQTVPNLVQEQSQLTQLEAQFASNPFPSTAHPFSALSFSEILSTIPFLSKHLKYASLASQHFAL
jgi:hypothetical protein